MSDSAPAQPTVSSSSDLQEARTSLVSVLKGIEEFCPALDMWAPSKPRYAGHNYCMDPLEGQRFMQAGRYRYYCTKGCGYDKVISLTGEEVWVA